MNAIRSFIGRSRALATDSLDLALVWWGLLVVQPLVPRGHLLARDDLAPWATLALAIAAGIRGRPLSSGPHPALRPRRSSTEAVSRQLGLSLVPVALLFAYDAGASSSLTTLAQAAGAAVASAVLLRIGGDHGRTAWRPDGEAVWRNRMLLLCYGSVAGLAGFAAHLRLAPDLSPAALTGLGFVAVSAAADRSAHLAQRRAAGRTDGQPWREPRFTLILALLGPTLSWWISLWISRAVGVEPGFDLGFVAALFVVVWAALVWQRPRATGVYCLLHEVVPTGGKDEAGEAASSFEAPPEGALRLDPITVRRTLHIHPWLVPVQDPRIGEVDDPVRPLWARSPAPLPSHTIGEVAFLPDPATLEPQTGEITLSLRGNRDMSALSGGDVQARRLVVLRPFPAPGEPRRGGGRTWRWERELPAGAIQVVDAATRAITLRDGDILVLGSEGVARAFEVELGEPMSADAPPSPPRLPQLEDYEEGAP